MSALLAYLRMWRQIVDIPRDWCRLIRGSRR